MAARYVMAHLLDAPYHIDKPYEYFVPPELSESIEAGYIIFVPFGGANNRKLALVISLSDAPSGDVSHIKPVIGIANYKYPLNADMLELCMFLHEQTLCTVGEALRAIVPPNLLAEVEEYYTAKSPSLEVSPPVESDIDYKLLSYVRENGKVSLGDITELFGRLSIASLERLTDHGYLKRACETGRARNIKYVKIISLAITVGAAIDILEGRSETKLRSATHKKMLSTIIEKGDMEASELSELTGGGSVQIHALSEKGIIKITEEERIRNPYASCAYKQDTSEILLSRAQSDAYHKLADLLDENQAAGALLYGITGSGKTKVIMKLIDKTLAQGRKAIMMVPEIALTPQTVSIFCSRYGDRVAVIHSSLSSGERFDTWRRIADGDVDLVIGTRSAVLSPLENIGLIVIDEEHEHTYKSDSNPKYHTRDVATFRAAKNGAVMLLASATPSLESFYRAERGKYTLACIRERYGSACLPAVEIVDMREELRCGRRSPLSNTLLERLGDAIECDQQAILFVNRRGYSSSLSCKKCGKVICCPNCSLSLTFHRKDDGGYLLCHCCGYRAVPPTACEECGSSHISYVGFGTQKAESELSLYLPEAKVLRMDADTTTAKFSHSKMLDGFRRHEYDVLLGTQMVTKGHDFPKVSLVGVLLADTSLYVNDFRASERTFSLITQVIGRAGRAEERGRAIIQTYVPENEVVQLAVSQDYDSFYKSEIAVRKSLTFPPFCDIAQFTFMAGDEHELMTAAEKFTSDLSTLAKEEYSDLPWRVFGPFEARQYKAAGKYRLRIIVKCRLCNRSRELFSRIMRSFGALGKRKITVSCDLNPSDV